MRSALKPTRFEAGFLRVFSVEASVIFALVAIFAGSALPGLAFARHHGFGWFLSLLLAASVGLVSAALASGAVFLLFRALDRSGRFRRAIRSNHKHGPNL